MGPRRAGCWLQAVPGSNAVATPAGPPGPHLLGGADVSTWRASCTQHLAEAGPGQGPGQQPRAGAPSAIAIISRSVAGLPGWWGSPALGEQPGWGGGEAGGSAGKRSRVMGHWPPRHHDETAQACEGTAAPALPRSLPLGTFPKPGRPRSSRLVHAWSPSSFFTPKTPPYCLSAVTPSPTPHPGHRSCVFHDDSFVFLRLSCP